MASDPTKTLDQTSAITLSASTLILAQNPGSSFGNTTLGAILTWLASQGADDAAMATGSGLLTGDQVVTLRAGVLTALPQSILGSGGGTSPATTFSVALSSASGAVGSPVTMTVTPGTGGWPSGVTVTPSATSIAGSFSPSTRSPTGTTAATFTFTPSAAATGTLNATATNMTSGGSASFTATAAAATAYAISTASTGTAGTPQTVTVTANGALSSSVVITLTDSSSGTFGGTVTLTSGSTSGTTSYTPASSGTKSITGTNNGTLTNPSAVSVVVAAAGAVTGHRYWRINTSSNAYGGYASLAEVAMATSSGGANVIGSGTPSASTVATTGYEANKAVDGNGATWWSATQPLPAWWAYDFGSGNAPAIAEVKITARNDSQDGANCAPSNFTLEWSDNGTTWTVRKAYAPTTWSPGGTQTFVVPATDPARPAMALSNAQFETAAPIGGVASLKGGAGSGTATIPLATNGLGGDQANASVYFRFQSKGGAALSSGAPFMRLATPNAGGFPLDLSFNGNSLVVTYNAATQSFPIRDGAVHEVSVAWTSYNQGTYMDAFVDGTRTRIADGASGYIAAGNATLTYTGSRLAVGDLLDDIEVKSGDHTSSSSTVAVRATPVTAASDTLALYQFEAQTGASS